MTHRKVRTTVWLIFICVLGLHAQETDSTGLPGDNFSLTAALEVFKKAESPEQFERMINTPDNNVNNLDLNGDGYTDYLKVIDRKETDAHAFIIQATVNENENQDIAVIELEKTSDGHAQLQIVGDADIYGEELIVEPASTHEKESENPLTVNVWTWQSVRYVYRPGYTVWVSPWGWKARPLWWNPWKPLRWHAFYPYRVPYHRHYAIVHHHRIVSAHKVYTPVRTTSVTVRNRNKIVVNNYRNNRSVKTVTTTNQRGPVKEVTQTTTVKNKKGAKKRAIRVKHRKK